MGRDKPDAQVWTTLGKLTWKCGWHLTGMHVGVDCTVCLGRDEPVGIEMWTALVRCQCRWHLAGIHVHVGAGGTGPELHGVEPTPGKDTGQVSQ